MAEYDTLWGYSLILGNFDFLKFVRILLNAHTFCNLHCSLLLTEKYLRTFDVHNLRVSPEVIYSSIKTFFISSSL